MGVPAARPGAPHAGAGPRYTGAVSFFLGVALFAVGIAVTIALHEWGHMTAARVFGMRVRRYFIGFGPTVASFRRRHPAAGGHVTEYGLKAVPLGGFCDIAGMTAADPVSPEEEPYAMYRRPWWARVAVLSGGVVMNLVVGVLLIYAVAVTWGLPDPDVDLSPRIAQTQCVPPAQGADGTLAECTGAGPAELAGLRAGDVVVAVGGAEVATPREVAEAVRATEGATVVLTVERVGQLMDVTVAPERVTRMVGGDAVEVAAVGIAFQAPRQRILEYDPLTAVPGSLAFTGHMFAAVWEGLLAIPGKVPGVVASVFGAERDPESPMSVVGASRFGGELAEADLWSMFVMMLANLNFFLAMFNLIPLPPLDGGHIAVVGYERLRDLLRRVRGLAPGAPVDYTRLMPVTLAFTAVLLAFGIIVIAADVVNPIRFF